MAVGTLLKRFCTEKSLFITLRSDCGGFAAPFRSAYDSCKPRKARLAVTLPQAVGRSLHPRMGVSSRNIPNLLSFSF